MSVLPKGKQWIGTYNGKRARLRNLTRVCAPALTAIDEEAIGLVGRARRATASKVFPEYAALLLVSRALAIETDTGTPWREALVYVLEEVERPEEEQAKMADGEHSASE